MIDSIDTTKQKAGFRFTASLETNLQAEEWWMLLARHDSVRRAGYGFLGGPIKGSSELSLELTDIKLNDDVCVLTSTYEIKGKGEGGNRRKRLLAVQDSARSSVGLLVAEREPGLALSSAAPVEQPSPLPKKADGSLLPSETLLEFQASNNRWHCQLLGSRGPAFHFTGVIRPERPSMPPRAA